MAINIFLSRKEWKGIGMQMISIVVPVYNAEKYLKKSIESILNQTYPAWEMILVDNGSEDNSFQICKEYAKQDERIQVLRQYQNRGVSVARNLGLERVGGNYLTFLDADDWVDEDYLKRLVDLQKETQADMLVCQFQKVYDADREMVNEGNRKAENFREKSRDEIANTEVSNKKESIESLEYQRKEYTRAEYLKQCLLEGYTHCWGVLYKTSLLEGIRFPAKMSIGEDALFLIDAVLQAERIVVTDYPGYKYYINENGAMMRKFTLSYMDQITCWQQAMEKLEKEYPDLKDKLESILVVSTMLVVGKIAQLEKEEQEQYQKEREICHNLVREHGRKGRVRKLLPSGYPLKVMLYDYLPNIYLKLYKKWKQ